MTTDFSMTLQVEQTPRQVFNAVLNVRGWWQGLYSEEIIGKTENVNDEFTFRAGGGVHFSRQKLVEAIPHERVVWLVTDSQLTFIENQAEWKGTKIVFEILETENQTQVRFTHQGLTPRVECYDSCSMAWSKYIQENLQALIQSQQTDR